MRDDHSPSNNCQLYVVTAVCMCRSLDSPSNSLEAVSGRATDTPHNGPLWDSDTEADIDIDPPDWKHTVPDEVLKNLSAHEIKRQEIINGNHS